MQQRSKFGMVLHTQLRKQVAMVVAGGSLALVAVLWLGNGLYEFQCSKDPDFVGCQYITYEPIVVLDPELIPPTDK